MDRIEKIINIDNSRSHRNGLLPFVRYGGSSIESVTAIEPNGNYGQYVCDFSIFKSNDDETFTEVARMKYLDVIRRYSFIHNAMINGVLTKKIEFTDEIVTKINCGDGVASSAEITTKTETSIKLIEDFSEIDELTLYDYIPLDARLFSKSDMFHSFYIPYEYLGVLEKEDSELTEDDKLFLEKIENHKSLLESSDDKKFFILINDYDEVIALNDLWEEWWINNFKSEGWREIVFDGYEEIDYSLQFYSDVNKYIIGNVEVPSKYNGSRVPSYVDYFTYFDLKNWFEVNSAATVSAEIEPTEENSWIIDNWYERGGGDFYVFLTGFTPLWQTNKTINDKKEGDNGLVFCYSIPRNDINVLINSEMDYETLYNVYEYSARNNEFEGAVSPYSPTPITDIKYISYAYNDETQKIEYINAYFYKDTIESITIDEVEYDKITVDSKKANGLTKQWLNLENDVYFASCESQLRTLIHPAATMISDKIFGIYKVYDESKPENGQMFKCTLCSGASKSAYTEIYYSKTITTTIYDEDGNIIDIIKKRPHINELVETFEEVEPQTNFAPYQVMDVKVIGSSAGTETSGGTTTEGDSVIEEEYIINKIWYEYSWWECSKSNATTLVCADGEDVSPNEDKKYRNVTILSCIESLLGPIKYGDYYYFLSRYDNGNTGSGNRSVNHIGEIKSIGTPYKENVEVNITTHNNGDVVYDKIFSIDYTDDGMAIIKYAKGITSGATEMESGIHYEEVLSCELNKKTTIPVDGVYMAEVYYDEIGFDGDKVEVYSNEYNLSRKTNIARITGMEICTQWTEEGAVEAMLITKDGSEGLQEEPRYNLNLLYNRGNAAAYESHFKLSECNTMEDLENYGNNFFNL